MKRESKTHGTDMRKLRRVQKQHHKSMDQTPNDNTVDEMNKNSEQLSSRSRR